MGAKILEPSRSRASPALQTLTSSTSIQSQISARTPQRFRGVQHVCAIYKKRFLKVRRKVLLW